MFKKLKLLYWKFKGFVPVVQSEYIQQIKDNEAVFGRIWGSKIFTSKIPKQKRMSKKECLISVILSHGQCKWGWCGACNFEGQFRDQLACMLIPKKIIIDNTININDIRYKNAVNKFIKKYGEGALVEILL